jgi:nucleotide-binding universal stress UspA family protein
MFKNILIPLDGSSLAEQALPTAAQIATAAHAVVDLVRVHPAPAFVATPRAVDRDIEGWADADRYLERRATAFEAETGLSVTHTVPAGDPVECICARASDIAADLIVMTSHGRTGFSRFWMGSIADAVVRRSKTPVLMLRASEDENATAAPVQFRRILVPLDGSPLAEEALTIAAELAKAENAELVLLQVVRPVPIVTSDVQTAWVGSLPMDEAATRLLATEARTYLQRQHAQLAERGVQRVQDHVMVSSHIAKAIIALAKTRQADAIVMSSHGRGMTRLVIGSVADKVLRGCDLPLLLHRPATIPAPTLVDSAEIEEQLPTLART